MSGRGGRAARHPRRPPIVLLRAGRPHHNGALPGVALVGLLLYNGCQTVATRASRPRGGAHSGRPRLRGWLAAMSRQLCWASLAAATALSISSAPASVMGARTSPVDGSSWWNSPSVVRSTRPSPMSNAPDGSSTPRTLVMISIPLPGLRAGRSVRQILECIQRSPAFT